ncbi:MAG: hypothetical protein HYR90_03220 [Candidatus Andersenbacteria bacterium]|nr:hypothetical protein [Candidatus Andersenbacteria bacterium]MBI3250274.1 hypothetical protein [Candidatus Andersenbacteria bacterium]
MKFAVLEYTSKTGAVWRHTPERPNYLSDPQKELDPTSFGCYVSALEGEHIPLTFLIKPTILKRVYKKLTGSWPAYDISYLKQFDTLMIVHQISNGHEITALTKRIKKEIPSIKILGVPTQPYGILKDYWTENLDWLKDFKGFIKACDIFVTIVKSTEKDWRALVPDHAQQVRYIPQPYPVEYAAQFFKPFREKKKIIFVAGLTNRDNITKGVEVAAQIQKQFPEYVIHIATLGEPGSEPDVSALQHSVFEVIRFEPWRQHLEYLTQTSLVVNTDYTQTRGRVQVDCAAIGTPSIGANSDGQMDLFPALPASREQSVADLVAQGSRLLQDEVLYASVVDTARQRLQQYNYQRSAERIQQLVSEL